MALNFTTTPTSVESASDAGGSTITGDLNTTTGDLIVVFVRWDDTSTATCEVTDDIGNTYVDSSSIGATDETIGTYHYCLASAGTNAANTITAAFSTGVTYRRLAALAYSYDDPIQLGMSSSGTISSGTHVVTAAAMSAIAGDLTVAGYGSYGSQHSSWDSPLVNLLGTTALLYVADYIGANTSVAGGNQDVFNSAFIYGLVFEAAPATLSLELAGFRFFDDIASESYGTLTGTEAQDTAITAPTAENHILATQIQAVSDPATTQFKLIYRKVGDADSEWEDLA